jgi:hypothetical protein
MTMRNRDTIAMTPRASLLKSCSYAALGLILNWATIAPSFAQAPAPGGAPTAPAPADDAGKGAQVYSMSDLEYLLGPIALYPDPLIALILPASTFPLQIVHADRWIAQNADAVKNNDFTGADAQPWDSSVQALARFPDVIAMLADHLDWTESLGAAFSQQPQDVANAIQALRAQAQKAGNLQSTPQQVVSTREESGAPVIFITPATPEQIFVPVYDPGVVFTTPLASALIFGTGILVGSYWNNRWGWNNRGWNTVWINQPVWHPGRPGGPPPGAWRPDRPGVGRPDRPNRPGGIRPDRPGGGRPDRPGGVRPDRPNLRPDRPNLPNRPDIRPDRPGRPNLPNRPDARPDRPGARPDRPAVRPDRPAARPDRPAVRPDRPGARPDRPAARPNVRPNRPQARPDRPAARPSRPAVSPNRPSANRPAARPSRPPAASRPAARPSRPQAAPSRPAARPSAPAGNRGRGRDR